MTDNNTVDERPVVLKVDHVAKSFRLPTEQATGLKMAFLNWTKGIKGYTEQHVLRDINFEVHQGDFFGIVGRNGSGKSTLLKIISQIYVPEQGSVMVKGKLVPFIELGVGFNPELTGRENVYLNGALLGFTHEEIDAMYDDIVEFAELEDFMDQKLKNYSSGRCVSPSPWPSRRRATFWCSTKCSPSATRRSSASVTTSSPKSRKIRPRRSFSSPTPWTR